MLRLQGFPEKFKIVCSYSQTRKQAGNSLPVPVAQAVIKNTLEACGLLPTYFKYETDKLIVDGRLRLFEKEKEYGEISETSNCPEIQATVSAQ
jgi:DNA (cytosine-5)-methyltransferase 1